MGIKAAELRLLTAAQRQEMAELVKDTAGDLAGILIEKGDDLEAGDEVKLKLQILDLRRDAIFLGAVTEDEVTSMREELDEAREEITGLLRKLEQKEQEVSSLRAMVFDQVEYEEVIEDDGDVESSSLTGGL